MLEISPYFYSFFDLNDPQEKDFCDGLIALFSTYIEKRQHTLAGKDAPYHQPPGTVVTDVNLRHVHLKPLNPSKESLEKWQKRRTSDRCLVYARSSCQRYLLIAYLHENAHAQAYDFDYLKALAKVGENWLYAENIFADLNGPF
ncbi:type II toxin-antitoxin system YafO family toxin [Pseudomonas sp. A2]|uniref:type II toxin-antitoxin system YafO family toxin n=1 Tax=Pseudomonas sp. A2 TaxID=107445 RepID=UPI001FFFD56F|nr:type II toxin-antitoxin system YafO family toxin [Pseudomonas sp. A2]UPK87344.1 hypothetical protein E5221_21255 [Pseudomonas sp. A2]